MKQERLVSVVLPTFNNANYIRAAVESILNQTYREIELIIIDDCSTDKSGDIIRGITDSRILYYRNSENKGIVESLNRGIAIAQGAFIVRMDGDDISVENRIERQVRFLECNEHIDFVGSWSRVFGEGITPYIYTVPVEYEEIIMQNLNFPPFVHPSITFRAQVFRNGAAYMPGFERVEDYYLWSRLLLQHKAANIPEALIHYRVHPNSTTSRARDEMIRKRNVVRKIYMKSLFRDIPDPLIEDFYSFEYGRKAGAIKKIEQTFQKNDYQLRAYFRKHALRIAYFDALERIKDTGKLNMNYCTLARFDALYILKTFGSLLKNKF